MGQAVGSIQRAYFAVFLVASPEVRQLAGAAWQAAWDIHDWFDAAEWTDVAALTQLLTTFKAKNTAFADAAQAEEFGGLARSRSYT